MTSPKAGDRSRDSRAGLELDLLFAPRSLAIIGATDRSASLGEIVLRNAVASPGLRAVHPVNPGRDKLAGLDCFPCASAIPGGADLAFILLPAERCAEAVRDCGAAGIRFAIIGASGFGEGGGAGAAEAAVLLEAASASGVRMLGPNTNGIWNATDDVHVGFNVSQGFRLRPGAIGLISQTGAMLGSTIAAVHERGVGIAYAVSTGNELDLRLHDHLEFMLRSDKVGAIGLAVDAIPEPGPFAETMRTWNRGRKPVVLLQMGTSKAGSAATELHASRVADRAGALSSLMARLGVAVTSDFDAYVSALMILGSGRQLFESERVLGLSSSGAGAALLADSGEAIGLAFEPLPDEVERELSGLMKLTRPHNPLDITGESRDPGWVGSVLDAFAAADPSAPVVYLITLMKEHPADPRVESYAKLAEQQPRRLFMACVPASLLPSYMERLRESGVLVYQSLNAMFGGIRLVREASRRAAAGVDAEWVGLWSERAPRVAAAPSAVQRRTLLHDELRPLLAGHGIGFPRETYAGNYAGELRSAVAATGLPVALKLLSAERLHKAASAALALGLASMEDVLDRAASMNPDRGDRFLVQQMVPTGLDLFIGYERDQRYSGTLLVGAGGSGVERVRDIETLLLPVSREDVRSALGRLRMADTLFSAGPGGPDWDVEALLDAIMGLAAFAEAGADLVAAEINPVRVLGRGQGAVALDARAVLADSKE
jgi:acyl-CoA synthetase (NDP forming)